MQMPRWLFSDPQYNGLSLESKVAYTFLLNRFQLSRRNGWVNRHGEVYVIYPREALAQEMQVSYRKAISCFKELAQKRLLWEHRQGRGMPNRIFLAEVQPVSYTPLVPSLRYPQEQQQLAGQKRQLQAAAHAHRLL